MKISIYFKALQISEALKKLNLDISQMNPNDRVKIKDGVVLFESEKECFVSAKNEPIRNSEQLEYYYLKEGEIVIKGDYFFNTKEWVLCMGLIGRLVNPIEVGSFCRKIQKNPTT